jgi:hypothetical protein
VMRSSKSKLNRNNKFSRTGLSSPVLEFYFSKKVCFFFREEKKIDYKICYNKYRIFFIIKKEPT